MIWNPQRRENSTHLVLNGRSMALRSIWKLPERLAGDTRNGQIRNFTFFGVFMNNKVYLIRYKGHFETFWDGGTALFHTIDLKQ